MSSIKQVAKMAGVSTATVSRVLNDNPNVKPHLKQKVLDAVQELDYHPSGIARGMRSQSSRIIGIVIPDIGNPFFTTVVRKIEDFAVQKQFKLLLCNSDRNPEKEKMYLELLVTERISGAIILPSNANALKPLIKYQIPFVFVNRAFPEIPVDSVVLDNFSGAYMATRHLLELGHTRIGLINTPEDPAVGLQRFEGFKKALSDSGIKSEKELIVCGEYDIQKSEEAALKLLELKQPPTAIFSLNNLMTIGMLKALNKKNVRIPEDISVIGFDDMDWLSFFSPPITVIQQPTQEIGQKAAELLFERLEKRYEGEPRQIILQPKLIVRESTKPVK